jgi:DNA invertase Pin-like site-specific DNA recombinase
MPGVSVGYARVSTVDQQAGLDAQLRDLKVAGCGEIFFEQVSPSLSVIASRRL